MATDDAAGNMQLALVVVAPAGAASGEGEGDLQLALLSEYERACFFRILATKERRPALMEGGEEGSPPPPNPQ